MSKMMYIRPSHLICYDTCPRMYYYRYVAQIKPDVTSANLPFGTAVHEAATGYVLSLFEQGSNFDPVKVFEEKFQTALEREGMEFSSLWDVDSMMATGKVLADRFAKAWDSSGFIPLFDENGAVIERRFQLQISESIILTGQPDIVFMNSDAQIGVLDVKTASQAYPETFLYAAEQLTDYQILLEGHAESLGLGEEGIEKLGFMELIKKKVPARAKDQLNPEKGPQVLAPKVIDGRSQAQKSERIEKIKNIASDIQKARFERRPLMAYNSPCGLCDFKDYCLKGVKDGLIFSSKGDDLDL